MALYTLSNHEKNVARYLERQGLEHYLPLIRSRRAWRNRVRVELELPLFQGYVFARLGRTDCWRAERASGVIRAVRIGPDPARLDDAEIESLRAGLYERNAQPHPSLIVGKKARILCGAFAGQQGILIRKEQNLRVVLTLLNVSLRFSVEVDGDEVEMLS
jgi:transcription antitermination factor NusG